MIASSEPWITSTGHRTRRQRARVASLVEPVAERRRDQRLRRRLEAPAHAVLDRLGRVRLVEHLREEELEEAAVVAQPVVAVVLRPALVGVELLVPAGGSTRPRPGSPSGTAGQMKTARSTRSRMLGREQQRPLRAERERDDHARAGRGRVHARQARRRRSRARRSRSPGRSERRCRVRRTSDAAVAREVGDLHLPVARVDDRPRRQQQDGRLAVAVDLVVDPHAVALDEAGLVRVAGARLLAGRARSARQPSVDPVEQLACPVSMPPRRSTMIPSVERHDERDERVERHRDAELAMRLARTPRSARARHSAFTRARRSRSSGSFHASACSSSQIFS